jgi:hypothetical protein
MRALGLSATSAGSLRAVKRSAARLGLDTSHFTGQRRWSDAQLRRASANAASWPDLADQLHVADHSGARSSIRAHAIRLGLDLSRFDEKPPAVDPAAVPRPELRRLRDSGAAIAAAWFMLGGCNVAFPIEPTYYDLLVSMNGKAVRIQVKTTTFSNGNEGWVVNVGRRPYSVGNRERKVPYDPETLEFFFILDGELSMYLIPSRALAGRVTVLVRSYARYLVGSARSLLESPVT